MPYIGDVLRKAKGRMLFAALPLLKIIKRPKKIVLALIGVNPDYTNTGVQVLHTTSFLKAYKDYHIEDVFVDPILTTNLGALDTWKGMEKSIRAKRQTFKKSIL